MSARKIGLVIAILVGTLLCVFLVFSVSPAAQPPEIAEDLPLTSKASIGKEFSRRVEARFSGLTEGALVEELERQGFKIYPQVRRANFYINKYTCAFDWRVAWEFDEAGKTRATGDFSKYNCIF